MAKRTIWNSTTVSSTGDIFPFETKDTDILNVHFFGTATTFTAEFKASYDGVNFFPIEGRDKGDSSIAINKTSTKDRAYNFDIPDINYFKVYISAISGGSITSVTNGIV